MTEIIENSKYSKLFGGKFELIDHGLHDGQFNMDFDLARAAALQKDDALPMLRLYGWNPWTISLGMNQKSEDINEQNCKELGFGLVRRPTGGRAVLHADELTYCVVIRIPEGLSIHDCYRDIHQLLVDGFKHLGCGNLGFEKSQPDFKEFYENKTLSVSCFASAARYEIEYRGRKLVGSAQHNYNGVLLQHGSILLGPGHEQIAEVANLNSDKERQILSKYILSHSSTMEEILGRSISYKECSEAIKSVVKLK